MPPITKVIKSCCPLCEQLEELKFRYDICESCHQDIVNDVDSEVDPDSRREGELEDPDSDELTDEEEPGAQEGYGGSDEKSQ